MKKPRYIYYKVLCVIALISIATTCRLFAGTAPFLSISYLGAGYAFQMSEQDNGDHFMVADTDIDDDGDQLNETGRSVYTFHSSLCYNFAMLAPSTCCRPMLPQYQFDRSTYLEQALPLRI